MRSDDPVKNVFGKNKEWRVVHPDEDRQILSKNFGASDTRDSLAMASTVNQVAEELSYKPEDVQFSISSRHLLVILHASNKGKITETDQALATRIDDAIHYS